MDTQEFATEDVRSVVDKLRRIMLEDGSPETSAESPLLLQRESPEPKPKKQSKPANTKTNTQQLSGAVSQKVFEKTTLARMRAYQQRHEDRIHKAQESREKEKMGNFPYSPCINNNSKKIIGRCAPIYSRVQEIIEDKNKRIEELTERAKIQKLAEENKELTFKPKTCESTSKKRTTEEYYNYMNKWKQVRLEVQEREREAKTKEESEKATFKPQIDGKSIEMTKNMIPFHERMEKEINKRKAQKEEWSKVPLYSFKPDIPKDNKPRDNVFERLYTRNMIYSKSPTPSRLTPPPTKRINSKSLNEKELKKVLKLAGQDESYESVEKPKAKVKIVVENEEKSEKIENLDFLKDLTESLLF
ncbi:unnamed protein product [Blepharisma stoltei]|uniref:Uncharacterized protein n=1 Tax=Blepharisma stoltei TaxID=1481888 RepID=A0AAU9IA64_9CILI|nr:unnamed protein product [Blepharisma stoltei]